MQKSELISLVDKMCKELLTIIDQQGEATVDQVARYLLESAELITNVNKEDINQIGFAESLFHNAYEEIAKQSISSYEKTNKSIEKLTKLQESALSQCEQDHIDMPSITSKFNEIQSHMSLEVAKANGIITKLTQQVKTLEAKTNLDPLTKVFNRRALSSYLENVCANAKVPLSMRILMLDIDNFKKINDVHGHIAGDKVLIFISNLLKKTLRDGDKIFRFGGEEFVIILNRIDDAHCVATANRLIELIRENKLIYKGNSLRATVSVGGTKYMEGDTPDSLISRADKALYEAKRNGKDQLHTEEMDGI